MRRERGRDRHRRVRRPLPPPRHARRRVDHRELTATHHEHADREWLAAYATRARRRLAETILPFWHDVTRDEVHGGYLVRPTFRRTGLRRIAHRVLRRGRPTRGDKQLVSQSRLVWVFSHAHRKGLHDAGVDYLAAAERGYRFLREKFLDSEHGGFRWMTDRAGRVVDDTKILYAQAFVIYAFVEYARAGGDPDALPLALEIHGVVDERLRDREHGGWFDRATRHWRVVPESDGRAPWGAAAALKSADTHLHWIEALTELYNATGDDDVRDSLLDARAVNLRHFFPLDVARSHQCRLPDWSAAPVDGDNAMSYGHNVEFIWLLLRAEAALGVEPSWGVFYAYLDHALRYGFDHRRGGAFRSGLDNRPATDRDKVFWVQAELAVALSDALSDRWDHRYSRALVQTLRFVERHQTDPADGVWIETVTAGGRRRVPRKAGPWKVGYHEVRALVKIAEAFGDTEGTPGRTS